MKQIVTNYSFSTSGKTITLTDFSAGHPVDLKRLYLIVDTTTNKILYNFADSTVSTATISSNNIVTLSALQGGEANSDSLMVLYDAAVGDPTYQIQQVQPSFSTGSTFPSYAMPMGMKVGGNNMGPMYSSSLLGPAGSAGDYYLAQMPYLFNGASNSADAWHNNWNTSTGDTGAKVASFNGATQTNYNARNAYITVLCGTVSGSTPTLAAQLQWSPDVGTTWLALGPASSNITATGNTITFLVGPQNWAQTPGATPANLTTGATQTVAITAPLPRTWRLAYTIGGGTPSFAITGVYVNYTAF